MSDSRTAVSLHADIYSRTVWIVWYCVKHQHSMNSNMKNSVLLIQHNIIDTTTHSLTFTHYTILSTTQCSCLISHNNNSTTSHNITSIVQATQPIFPALSHATSPFKVILLLLNLINPTTNDIVLLIHHTT